VFLRHRALAGIAVAACAVASMAAGCGEVRANGGPAPTHTTAQIALHGHPQVVDPVAGAMPSESASSAAVGDGGGEVSVSSSGVALQTQPESNTEVERELGASGINPNPNRATLTSSGLAIAPANAPAPVVAAINAANEIAHLKYTWGGGHGTYEDTGYDCSGSLSFILAAAGLLNGTETSGQLMSYGASGPGKWISIWANDGHTFAEIAGLRFDTVALAETGTRWSNRSPDEPDINTFAVRHPVGL
jgi:hypothetical protein